MSLAISYGPRITWQDIFQKRDKARHIRPRRTHASHGWQVFTTFCSHVHSREGRRYIGDMQRILENPRSVCPRKALHKHPLIAIRPEEGLLVKGHVHRLPFNPSVRLRALSFPKKALIKTFGRCQFTCVPFYRFTSCCPPSRCTHCNWQRKREPRMQIHHPLQSNDNVPFRHIIQLDTMQMQAVEKCGCKQPNLPWFANLSEFSFITKRRSLHVPQQM